MIRPARREDLDGYRRLLAEAGLPLQGMEDQLEDSFLVAIADERVVGGAGIQVWGRDGLLRSVVVAGDRRGEGIAAALLRQSLERAWTRGAEQVFLLTTDAAPYFERHGFRVTPRDQVPPLLLETPEFATICPVSATVMRRGATPKVDGNGQDRIATEWSQR